MFAFVQWHLFITAMELHRIHKVDLVVIYIQSVDHAVYELIKLYQADGLVEIRVGISMPPHLDTLGYNPNSESQWNDQLVNFEDCLYDFRESTEFIAFPDWDDLMMTDHSVPHSEILETFRNDFPKVGYYKIFRYLGAMPNLGTIMHKKYKLKHLWKHALLFTKNRTVIHQTLPKIIVRPKYINSVGLHDSYLAAGFIDKEISLDQLYMVHARDFDDYSLQTRLSAVDMMVKNFEKFSSSYTNITSVFRKVPKDDPFMDQFNHCLGYKGAWDRWSKMVKTAAKSIKSKCFTYFQCGMEKIKHRCYNARNTWIKAAQSKTQFVLKLSTNSFVKRNYCSV